MLDQQFKSQETQLSIVKPEYLTENQIISKNIETNDTIKPQRKSQQNSNKIVNQPKEELINIDHISSNMKKQFDDQLNEIKNQFSAQHETLLKEISDLKVENK